MKATLMCRKAHCMVKGVLVVSSSGGAPCFTAKGIKPGAGCQCSCFICEVSHFDPGAGSDNCDTRTISKI